MYSEYAKRLKDPAYQFVTLACIVRHQSWPSLYSPHSYLIFWVCLENFCVFLGYQHMNFVTIASPIWQIKLYYSISSLSFSHSFIFLDLWRPHSLTRIRLPCCRQLPVRLRRLTTASATAGANQSKLYALATSTAQPRVQHCPCARLLAISPTTTAGYTIVRSSPLYPAEHK